MVIITRQDEVIKKYFTRWSTENILTEFYCQHFKLIILLPHVSMPHVSHLITLWSPDYRILGLPPLTWHHLVTTSSFEGIAPVWSAQHWHVQMRATISIPVWNDLKWRFEGNAPAEMMVGADYGWSNDVISEPSEHSDQQTNYFTDLPEWLQEKGEQRRRMGKHVQEVVWVNNALASFLECVR